MFKILVLKSLYSLSHETLEYQIRDRISFMRFLGLTLHDDVPDEKTIWLFEDALTKRDRVKTLFEQFDVFLNEKGYTACKGSLTNARIVEVPRQRNSREENEQIKAGQRPVSFDELLDERNRNKDVYGDGVYRCKAISQALRSEGYRDNRGRIHRWAYRNRPLSQRSQEANRKKSRVLAEHIFGRQAQLACYVGKTLLRGIGLAKATALIGLANITYNLDCYRRLTA